MKAVVQRGFGSADVLHVEDVPVPAPGKFQVRIEVRAAGLNPLDWRLMHGLPLLRFPGATMRPGVDVAGVVDAVGPGARRFRPGDEVYGTCRGSLAERACAAEFALARKPSILRWDQAGGVGVAGYTAVQSLRQRGFVQPGRHVLVNGASGGVGTFVVQIAKVFGAHVTAVTSGANEELVRRLGADRVIDYTREDFTSDPAARYDLIVDCVGNHAPAACARVLRPKGSMVLVGAKSLGSIATHALQALALSLFTPRHFGVFITKGVPGDLFLLAEMLSTGRVVPVIDRAFRLSEVREAIRYLEQGHARGKVVVLP